MSEQPINGHAPQPQAQQTDLLDLLDAVAENPQPLAQQHRDRIRAAIVADGRAHGGEVNPNRVRALLTNDAGHLTVNPRRLAAAYCSPLLVKVGEVRSDDTRGRNVGAVVGLYRFRETT